VLTPADGFPELTTILLVNERNVHLLDCSGLVPWPPQSPDFTPLDYFIWGHVKSLIYDTPVDNEFELLARILAAYD
jgi:hypothetical protein